MRQKINFHVCAIHSLILSVILLLPVTASAQKILRYSDHEPLGNMRTRFINDVFFTAIENESNGRLKIEARWNSELATGYPVAFFSTTPLNNLNDISGKKWRSASFWHKSFLQNSGAIPVTMPWGEGVREALEDGTLNGLMVNIDSGDDIKAQQAAPYVLASPDLWLGHLYIVAINKTTGDSLSKRDKEAIRRAATTAYGLLGGLMKSSFEALAGDLRKDNINIRLLNPEEVKQWETLTKYKETQAAWVKEQEDKGVEDVGAVLEKVSAIMNDVFVAGKNCKITN